MEIKSLVGKFSNLYSAMKKCKRGVMWKTSTANFVLHGLIGCLKLRKSLFKGSYKISKYSIFEIFEPKHRKIVSTRIKDRVFQRSLCDNYLTKEITKSFIYDNAACQVDKGTDFARKRLKCLMQRYFRKHGLKGYVLKCDIHDYFGSTAHDIAAKAVHKRVSDDWAYEETKRIIDSFNQGENPDVGMGLGSQVTQLIELAVLDNLDHYIKEQLRIKPYVRYMDDFILIHEDRDYLKHCLFEITDRLAELGLTLNTKKTQIFPITQPLHFLGFSFLLTSTGKVVMKLLPEKVTHERRKLKRQLNLVRKGQMTIEQVDRCFASWVAHASKGDCYRLIKSMRKYYADLKLSLT